MREQLVKQRIEQRLLSAKKIRSLDMDKCPLLSKPGEMYLRSRNLFKKQSTIGGSATSNHLTDLFASSTSWLKNSSTFNLVSSLTSTQSSNLNIYKSSEKASTTSTTSITKPSTSPLRLIYPQQKPKSSGYDRIQLVEHISDIFMCFTLFSRSKFMSHSGFRSFVKYMNL